MVAKIIRGMCVSVAGTAFASLLQYALMSGEITWWVPLTGAGGAMALLILLESYRREISTEHVSSLTPAQRVEVEKIGVDPISWTVMDLGERGVAGSFRS